MTESGQSPFKGYVDPPFTLEFLERSLENQLKIHDFMGSSDPGSPSQTVYIEGLRQSAEYLLRRLRTEGLTIKLQ